jgi:hypothetical protein
MRILAPATACFLVTFLAACSSLWPFGSGDTTTATTTSSDTVAVAPGAGLGVNAILWRASLDTLNFMPLANTDPAGGIINTDWYAAPENPNERMKVTVYILDRRLRADALKVSVFRQIRSASGFVDAQVNADTAVKLENAILTRARELNLAAMPVE